jgi:hypothetical protein
MVMLDSPEYNQKQAASHSLRSPEGANFAVRRIIGSEQAWPNRSLEGHGYGDGGRHPDASRKSCETCDIW